jgi:hypothetical protein
MTVAELIEALSDMPEDAEVRFATQPSWPFEYSIREPVLVDLASDPDDEDRRTDEPLDEPVVYIPEGAQLAYLPGAARDEIGW